MANTGNGRNWYRGNNGNYNGGSQRNNDALEEEAPPLKPFICLTLNGFFCKKDGRIVDIADTQEEAIERIKKMIKLSVAGLTRNDTARRNAMLPDGTEVVISGWVIVAIEAGCKNSSELFERFGLNTGANVAEVKASAASMFASLD